MLTFGIDCAVSGSRMTRRPLLLVVLAAALATACVASPTSPSAPSGPQDAPPPPVEESLPVRVYVLEYGTDDSPLPGAIVSVNNQVAGQTDDDGFTMVTVARGLPVTIRVDHAGYLGFSVEGTVWGYSESWSFWLGPIESDAIVSR